MVLIKEIELQLNRERKKTDIEAVEDELIKDSVLELANADFTGEDFEPPQELGSVRKGAPLQTPLGPKYDGKPTSRRRQANDEPLEAFSDESDSLGEEEAEEVESGQSDDDDEGDTADQEDDEDLDDEEEEMSDDEGSDMGLADAQKSFQSGDINIFSDRAKDINEDVAKGRAIKNQLNLWENLLECRIKFQPSLVAVNKLFQTENLKQFRSQLEPQDEAVVNKAYSALADVLNKFIDLQEKLAEQAGIQNDPTTGKTDQSDDESIASSEASGVEEDPEDVRNSTDTKDATKSPPPRKKRKLSKNVDVVQEKYADFAKIRDESIQKWYDRTRVSSGKMSSSDFSAFQQTTLKQIEASLYDRGRLVKKTQLKRSVYETLGKTPDDAVEEMKPTEGDIDDYDVERVDVKSKTQNEYDEEIFDDDDFYHKLLRDFVERSCSEAGGLGELAKQRQWLELQKLRSKMKRKIDTKASKGRKLRYTVHNKLVNFMAPIPTGTWTEDAQRKLFASLFGRAS